MWRTPDGVAHTVALPDATDAMTAEFVQSLDRLDASERRKLASLIAVSTNVIFDAPREQSDSVDLASTEPSRTAICTVRTRPPWTSSLT
jgi:hypothetical protein